MQTDAEAQTPLQVVLQRKWFVLAFALSLAALAFAFLMSLPKTYTAEASVAIGTGHQQVLVGNSVMAAPQLDLDLLRTEMEGFYAPAITEAVVRQFGLTHNPEFCGHAESTVEANGPWWRRLLPSRDIPPCTDSVDKAARRLAGSLTFNNDSRSYIVRVGASARDPQLAAAIANAVAQHYVERQRSSGVADTQQADVWLTDYLEKLRRQTQDADAAVASYRRQHQLTPLRGETLVGQSLAELNTQLTVATSDLTQKRSQLQQLQAIAAGRGQLDATAPALASPLIQRLMEQQAVQAATLSELQTRYGRSHPLVKANAAQVFRIQQQVRAEVEKILASFKDEVAALQTRRAALAQSVGQLQAEAARQAQDAVRLQELQRDADADRQLYQSMLIRLKEIDAQQGLQQASARIVVAAQPPEFASFPRTKMMVVGTFLAALGVGALGAIGLSSVSRRFRSVDQLEAETGLPVLGLFPRPPRRAMPHDVVVDQPMSLESEALHAILIGLSRRGPGGRAPAKQVVMIASALPGEGKTSFALALGRSATSASLSVALLDCDMRRPSLTRLVAPRDQSNGGPGTDLADVQGVDAAVDGRSGLHIVPIASCVRNPHELLVPHGIERVLNFLRENYDVVIIDTPPVLAVPDALNLAPFADQILLLSCWRQTPRAALAAAVERLRRSAADVSGIVLTKVDLRQFARHEAASGYYATRYPDYSDRATLADT
ncbi:MAG TPA: polysaccharide biosynthesis tyrosine autokinase [Acetobacteraceae bacterium]|nr:polysaccharide biosynthesis tyrosine autokinase [Acetobacteraceae bacterium]